MTPPNALVTPNPESSVMMSRTLGAPFFAVTFGGQYGCEFAATRSILPPNFDGGGGSCLPSIVVVAAGGPGGGSGFGRSLPSCWGAGRGFSMLFAAMEPATALAATTRAAAIRVRVNIDMRRSPVIGPIDPSLATRMAAGSDRQALILGPPSVVTSGDKSCPSARCGALA